MGAPIVHIEFRSSSFERTAAFYGQLFEWQTQQNAAGSYMKFGGEDGPSGGFVRADLVQAPGAIPYLVVDDLATKMAEVEKAGGRVLVGSMPFAGGGEVGLFADPDGNVVGLWMRKKQAGEATAAAPAPSAAVAAPSQPAPPRPEASTKARKPAAKAPAKKAIPKPKKK
jgi:predicted enzyme related to lactoylglutathione lyase